MAAVVYVTASWGYRAILSIKGVLTKVALALTLSLAVATMSKASKGSAEVVKVGGAAAPPAKKVEKKTEKKPQDNATDYVRQNEKDLLQKFLVDNKEAKLVNKLDRFGKNVLMTAAEEGNVDILNMLLTEFKANVNFVSRVKNTALLYSAIAGEISTFELLLAAGAKIDVVGEKLHTALHYSCLREWPGHFKVVNKILETLRSDAYASSSSTKKADFLEVRNQDNETALAVAFKMGNMEAVRLIVEAGGDINTTTQGGNTQAHRCAFDGRLNVLKFFLSNRGDFKRLNDNGETPAFISLKCERLEVFDELRRSGAGVNDRDLNGRTPLMIACMLMKHDLVYKLVNEYDADVNLLDTWGYSAIMFVAKAPQPKAVDVCEFLISKGADINSLDRNYNNALHYACLKNNMAIAAILINNGADYTNLNIDEKTPLDVMNVVASIDRINDLIAEVSDDGREGGAVAIKAPEVSSVSSEKPRWLRHINEGIPEFQPIYRLKDMGGYLFIDLEEEAAEQRRREEEEAARKRACDREEVASVLLGVMALVAGKDDFDEVMGAMNSLLARIVIGLMAC